MVIWQRWVKLRKNPMTRGLGRTWTRDDDVFLSVCVTPFSSSIDNININSWNNKRRRNEEKGVGRSSRAPSLVHSHCKTLKGKEKEVALAALLLHRLLLSLAAALRARVLPCGCRGLGFFLPPTPFLWMLNNPHCGSRYTVPLPCLRSLSRFLFSCFVFVFFFRDRRCFLNVSARDNAAPNEGERRGEIRRSASSFGV